MIQIADIQSRIYDANGVTFEMVTVEKRAKKGGEYDFIMGDDNSPYESEKPAHPVTFKTDFEIGKYPVIQELWEAVMGKENNLSYFKGSSRPVEQVSSNDIVFGNKEKNSPTFLDKLNAMPAIQRQNLADGKQFRLPTEAQWEYAARGGKYWQKLNYRHAGSNQLKEVGWFVHNSHRETKSVGLKMPNSLGIYDMSGNIWEWCEDSWRENYEDAPEDGSAWGKGEKEDRRVVRGGSWRDYVGDCRVSFRFGYFSYSHYDNFGFRLSRY